MVVHFHCARGEVGSGSFSTGTEISSCPRWVCVLTGHWKNFRVLIITNTSERAANIRAAILRNPVLEASPLFLVSDKPSLHASDILKHAWLDAHGKSHALI